MTTCESPQTVFFPLRKCVLSLPFHANKIKVIKQRFLLATVFGCEFWISKNLFGDIFKFICYLYMYRIDYVAVNSICLVMSGLVRPGGIVFTRLFLCEQLFAFFPHQIQIVEKSRHAFCVPFHFKKFKKLKKNTFLQTKTGNHVALKCIF